MKKIACLLLLLVFVSVNLLSAGGQGKRRSRTSKNAEANLTGAFEDFQEIGKILIKNGTAANPDKVFFKYGKDELEVIPSQKINSLINLIGLEEKSFSIIGRKVYSGTAWKLRIDEFEEHVEKVQPVDTSKPKDKNEESVKKQE